MENEQQNSEDPRELSDNENGSQNPRPADLQALEGLTIGPDWIAPGYRSPAPKSDRGAGGSLERRTRSDGKPRDRRARIPGSGRGKPREDRPRSDRPRSDRRHAEHGAQMRPMFDVQVFPEDAPFKALVQAMRQSNRTYDLFELAQLVLAKPDRFSVLLRPLADGRDGLESEPFFISVPDGLPFESEQEAVDHIVKHYLDDFFRVETVEVEAPTGNFQSINKCGFTGALLGPPNFHRYAELERQHHGNRVAQVSLEKFRGRIESVRDPEVIAQWSEEMTKQMRYFPKNDPDGAGGDGFMTLDAAKRFLLIKQGEMSVRNAAAARFSGRNLQRLPAGHKVRRSVELAVQAQQRFPMDTANHIRGRFKRMRINVYKKGSGGISYVCAVRRRFREPGEVFADDVESLIEFIEGNPETPARTLPERFLGIEIPKTDGGDGSPVAAKSGESKGPGNDQARLGVLAQNLRWLVAEGYVVEYADGRLYAPKPRPRRPDSRSRKPDPESVTGTSGEQVPEDPTDPETAFREEMGD